MADEWDGLNEQRRDYVAVLDARLETLHGDVGEMKLVLRELTQAITKLALIEERQAQAAQAQERAFTALAKVEERVSKIEQRLPVLSASSVWVDRGVTATVAAAAMYIAKKTGLL